MGDATAAQWHDALSEKSCGKLKAKKYADNTKFKGIGDSLKQSHGGVAWPTRLAGKLGQLKTSILEGGQPCLLSVRALASLGAVMCFDPDDPWVIFSTISSERIPLHRAPNGHLLLNIFDSSTWSKMPRLMRQIPR